MIYRAIHHIRFASFSIYSNVTVSKRLLGFYLKISKVFPYFSLHHNFKRYDLRNACFEWKSEERSGRMFKIFERGIENKGTKRKTFSLSSQTTRLIGEREWHCNNFRLAAWNFERATRSLRGDDRRRSTNTGCPLYFASFLSLVNDIAVVVFCCNGHVQVSFNVHRAKRSSKAIVPSNKSTIVPRLTQGPLVLHSSIRELCLLNNHSRMEETLDATEIIIRIYIVNFFLTREKKEVNRCLKCRSTRSFNNVASL